STPPGLNRTDGTIHSQKTANLRTRGTAPFCIIERLPLNKRNKPFGFNIPKMLGQHLDSLDFDFCVGNH
ncbi:MAG: hypothetical protein U9N87_06805, partial [Planctomycetota bacterium]|nr:hypothetical protein [Planctomycetota bacterium]